MVSEHGHKVFFVHRLSQVFQHSAQLNGYGGVRIDTGTFEHSFKVFLDGFEEVLFGEFHVADVDLERLTTGFGKYDQHGGFEQQLLLCAIIPLGRGLRYILEVFLEIRIPRYIPLTCSRPESKQPALVMYVRDPLLEVFDAFRWWIFWNRHDTSAGAVDENATSGKATRKDVHFEIPFKHMGGETTEKGDVGM